MVNGPLAEGAGRDTGDLGDGVRDVGRLADGGAPGGEEHVGDGGGVRRPGAAEFVGGNLFDGDGPANGGGDGFDLLALGEGLRAAEDRIGRVGGGVAEGAHGDGGDIALVNGCGGSVEEERR